MRSARRVHLQSVLATGALLLGVATLGLTASSDGDIFWHLAAGREMVSRGTLLTSDPFSISAFGKPWADVHWLFQLIAFGVHALGGLKALVVGKALILALGAWLLSRVVQLRAGSGALPSFAVAGLASLLAVRELLLLRPTIFTLLLLAAFIYVVEHARVRGRPRWLWALPFLQILWVNVQGLFALGPAVIFAYWLACTAHARWGARRWYPFGSELPPENAAKPLRTGLLLSALASLGACCVNPFGLAVVELPGELLRRLLPGSSNVFAANIAENVPPFLLERATGQFWHLEGFLVFLAAAVVAGRRRMLLSHCLLVGGFLVLALIANRNVLLLYWVATPFAVIYLFGGALRALARIGAHGTSFSRRARRGVGRGALSTALAALAVCIGTVAAREPALAAPAPFRVPELSARWIADHGGRSRIFAADHYGGYLIWKLFPAHTPYIDTRLVLRTEEQFVEYLGVVDDPSRFDDFAERHRFDYCVLPTGYPDRYLALLRHLSENPRWKLLLTDGTETLFGRVEVSTAPAMDLARASTTRSLIAEIGRRFPDPRTREAGLLQLATLELALGFPAEAERALESVEGLPAEGLRARARLALGDADGARRLALRVLNDDAEHVRSLNLLAAIELERGEVGNAASLLRRSVRADPFDVETLAVLQSLEQTHDPNP